MNKKTIRIDTGGVPVGVDPRTTPQEYGCAWVKLRHLREAQQQAMKEVDTEDTSRSQEE